MYRLSRFGLFFALLILTTAMVSAQSITTRGGSISPVDTSNAFVHKTTSDDTFFNTSVLTSEMDGSSPLLQNNPNAVVFLTRNVTQSTAYHAVPYGVYYTGDSWAVFNQSLGNTLALGVGFNTQVMGKGDTVFVHTVTAENRSVDLPQLTILDHPLLNNDNVAAAKIIVTPNWTAVYNNKEIGVYYDEGLGRWTIFNQDVSVMPIGAVFNVQIVRDADTGFRHFTTVGNIVYTSKTTLDNVFLNNNPNAQFLVTQNWSYSDIGVYNNESIGVEYDNASQRWLISNIDGSAMPASAGFNILVTHTGDFVGDGVLYNGGFEVPLGAKKTPINWNTTKVGGGSKRLCNKYAPQSPADKQVAMIGECAYLLKGKAGEMRKLVQTITFAPSISANSYIDLLATVKAKNAIKAKIKGVVRLSDGSKVVYVVPPTTLNGTYDWVNVTAGTAYNAATQPVKLTLTIFIGGGALYLDGLSSAVFQPVR